jgi:long-subunit acyl-CoA synthetase (AMP-forming)
MTPTMKLRRKAVSEKYAAEIEQIYARPRPGAATAAM